MPEPADGLSFYLFDFDDNIMFLKTNIVLLNTVTKQELPVTTGDFAIIFPQLGRPGKWEDYAIFDGTYRDFRDLPADGGAAGLEQPFVRDVKEAVSAGGGSWKAPSWDLFVYACAHQRPVSIVTARGHQPETLKAGVRALVDAGLLPCEPNYHTVFPVGNEVVRREELGDEALIATTPALKKVAIIQSVELALSKYGSEPPHRFGMSDDDPQNVNLIISAMTYCKLKYSDQRFFVINTHFDQKIKLELFPIDFPVARQPGLEAAANEDAPDPLLQRFPRGGQP